MVDSNAGRLALVLALAAAVPSCDDEASGPASWSLGLETMTAFVAGVHGADTIVELRCPDGSVGVGYQGRHGSRIDVLRLRCAELRADGRLGAHSITDSVGTSVGGTAISSLCSADGRVPTLLVGDRGVVGQVIYQALGQCRRPADVAAGAFNDSTALTTVRLGSDPGVAYTLFCPNGFAVTGLRGRRETQTGTGLVAALGLICREVLGG
jgi:hypothetical protein